jgi:DNA polymerase
MMVSKNPGMGVPQESDLYKPLSAADRVQAHENFVRRRFEGKNPLITSTYHANILDWVAIILGVEPTHEAVFSKAAMTALAKCESLVDKTSAIPDSTSMHCSSKFLFREIDLIKPKYLLALGNEVERFLTRPAIQQIHGLPVGKLYHPSWTNMRGGVARYKSEVLPEIRADYLRACA